MVQWYDCFCALVGMVCFDFDVLWEVGEQMVHFGDVVLS